ncbi:Lrp/AsnC family transcriptional regulator [Clostridium cylindrosporum]|nr:Lrp/AsnC family transcriptional regulator [Clostridium cylindrosporum]
MIDEIDFKILNILKKNSKVKWKDIGNEIHMTGQAVGMRIKRLEEKEIIKAYTILIDELKICKCYIAFITVIMKSNNHAGFQIYIKNEPSIIEAHRISGDGCYMLKVKVESEEELNILLDDVLKHGNYRLNISISMIK